MWQYNSDVLCHWGIKGQKWGVRRYQNRDGTLTPAGKIRYADGSGADSKKIKNVTSSDKVSVSKSTSIKDMSDDDLNRIISRLQREKQLKALLSEDSTSSDNANKKVETNGNNYITKALKEGGSQALSAITKTVVLYAGGKIVASIFNNPELGKSISSAVSDSKKPSSLSDDEKVNNSKASTSSGDAKKKTTSTSSGDRKKTANSKATFTEKESPKTSASAKSKDDPVNARFREVFDIKFKDIKGEGSSKYKPESDTIIDVDFRDVENTGKDFINNYMRNQLLLPYSDRDKM